MFKLSPFLTAYWSYTEYGAFVCCKSAANCQECALRRTKHIQPLRRKYLDLRRGPFTLSSWRKETQLRRKPRCLRAELRHTHTHTQCTHTHTHTHRTHTCTHSGSSSANNLLATLLLSYFCLSSSLQSSVPPEDFRVINISKSISPINYERLNSWRLKLMYTSDSSVTK